MISYAVRLLRFVHRFWRIKTNPIAYARSIGVDVGDRCRLINVSPQTFGSEPYLISIGDHVTITSGVRFITHDGGVWVFRDEHPDIDVVQPITIGNNVFVGIESVIMPGVTIGDNCVIGARSVVTRDIPAGHVAVGVPAKPIKTIEEYWESIRERAYNVRSLSAADKRATFIDGRNRVQGGTYDTP